ncbi:hypothetical protein BaRGS_00027763, partial [Batillaria attramentaria]
DTPHPASGRKTEQGNYQNIAARFEHVSWHNCPVTGPQGIQIPLARLASVPPA